MKDILAAQRYAGALLELVKPLGKDEEAEAELVAFSETLRASPELERVLNHPKLSTEDRKRLISKLYSGTAGEIYPILVQFFGVLFQKNRFSLIHEIAASFKRIADEAQGQALAEIKTAVPLDASAQGKIAAKLERITGLKITIKNQTDPSLIGGVLVKVRNRVIDGSVRNRVDEIKKALTKTRSI